MGFENTINAEKKTIMRYLSGRNFCILTRRLIELEQEMEMWLTIDIPGAIIYGHPRVGKTTAITYLANSLGKFYGDDIPVIRWDITDHVPTEKQFYSSFMHTLGLPLPSFRDTALVLKTRIINTLLVLGAETKYKMIILLIDEASLLNVKDFVWLMDLYNSLVHHDILLMTFMFGTYALKVMKESLKYRGESQIIGRFMSKEYVFKGICSKGELQQCLLALDQPLKVDTIEREIILPAYFFPNAYIDGKFFSTDLTSVYWDAFNKVKFDSGISAEEDIQMQYFLSSFKHCVSIFGKGGPKEKYFPEQKDLEICIIESGYPEMNCIYSDYSTQKSERTKKRKGK